MMEAAAVAGFTAPARPSLFDTVREGLRTALFLRPRWDRVAPGPYRLAALVLLQIAASICMTRLYFDGDAAFQWRAVLSNWLSFVLLAWASYLMRNKTGVVTGPARAPSAIHLFTVLTANFAWFILLTGAVHVGLTRTGPGMRSQQVAWAIWLAPLVWAALAQLVLLLRGGDKAPWRRVLGVIAMIGVHALPYVETPAYFWGAAREAVAAEEAEPLRFTQEAVENQAPLLAARLDALAPQRPGIADMYTITFAPYEGEEVFRRESRMVSEVMAKRFDAAGRGIQLINHRQHLQDMPWATPLNLRRAIERIADTMDRDEDVLFIHLTSHGANDGELAVNFWPLEVDPVMPDDLKKWLDAAGIRHRVLSISACYSGNWIAPLASDDTLVMTASDADHTSYGCGKKSELTFFGRAMYDEQLRTHTRSFTQAHATARKVIDKREKEAGKSDGYSNPQIKMGSRIAGYLDAMVRRLEQKPAPR